MSDHDEVTDPRASALPAAAATLPIDDVPSAKDRVFSALTTALNAAAYLPPGREAAIVKTKIEEAQLWLTRCSE